MGVCDFGCKDLELGNEVAWAEMAIERAILDGIVVGAFNEDCA